MSIALLALAPASAGGAPPAIRGAAGLSTADATLWKYVARCALRSDQTLDVPGTPAGGPESSFPGALGLAPEWRDGLCDAVCQEKVSACLLAHINPTGKHVPISLLSEAPSLQALRPGESDIGFPYQEGAFFGNVFTGEGYACRGDDVAKAAKLNRTCALTPATCSSPLAKFTDAGACATSCDLACATLSDGTRRCAAVRCRDPGGRIWNSPVTTYLRDERGIGGKSHPASGARHRAAGPASH